jgi:hypothetical protein
MSFAPESYLNAANAEELLAQLRADDEYLGQIAGNRKLIKDSEWYERHQMIALLRCKAHVLNYPVRVFHTSDSFPDFLLHTGDVIVGVEATRIANEQLSRLRSMGLQKPMCISPFLVKGPNRTNSQIANEALIPGQFEFGNTEEALHKFWIETARRRIADKTKKLNERDQVLPKNWLLLWDQLFGEDSLPEYLRSVIEVEKYPVPAPERRWDLIVWQDEQLRPSHFLEF